MEHHYSPYRKRHPESKKRFSLPKVKLPFNFPKGLKLWVSLLLGLILGIFLIAYLLLGELRFFANHFLGLGFFSKNYVVLLQNNYELRPGGGFITGFGNLNIFMGIPSDIDFKNSYEIDTEKYINPPYPHEELLKNEWYEGYTFRDANWSADFPENASELSKFYLEKYPDKDIDGFIVINFSLIEELIGVMGGIEIDGKNYTQQNLFSELEFEVNNIDRHNVEALQNRKNILGELAKALIGKIKTNPLKAKKVIVDGLHNKNLFLWLKNERLQNKIIKKGWGNSLSPNTGADFLAVNLANLGSKKADRYIQSEVHYFANISQPIPEITTEFTLRYPGELNTYSDNYKGYLRLYIPKNADPKNIPVDSRVTVEGEFKVIGTQIILPAGGKTSLIYSYTLPRNLFDANQYKLRLVKQAGSNPLYKLTIQTTEGQGFQGEDFSLTENRALYIGKLTSDHDFSLQITPDTTPPYPIEQQFTDLNQIEIIWNEYLSEAANVNQYKVTDINKVDPTSDEIVVESVEVINDLVVLLNLSGVTQQDLEAYKIEMNNIKDMSGNTILPNPKVITAIQRIVKKNEAPEIKLGEIPVDLDIIEENVVGIE